METIQENQEMKYSSRVTARETGRNSARESTRDPAMSFRSDAPDSFRSNMSTGRVHTAIAALTAQRHALEQRLLQVNAALENESRRPVQKPKIAVVGKKKPKIHYVSQKEMEEAVSHGKGARIALTENILLSQKEQREKHLKKSLVF